jgi:MFS superfamily sulfate permease-like transporter
MLPTFDGALWMKILAPAMLICIVGYVESISAALTLAAKRRQRIDPDQELIALGVSNVGSAVSGGFPVTGALSRSVVNFEAGAQTPAAGAFTAVGVALATLFLTPLLVFLPKATLAAIIIIARSSAAIASELALMKTRQEMSSLTRMGISPQDYLLVPRIAGVTLAVLALTIYFQVVAIGGGLAISAMYQNVAYLDQVGRFLQTVKLSEFAVVAFKGCLFGLAISTISCYNGMQAQPSVTEVPKVAIRAVLQSLLFVFTLDALIAYFSMA